MYVSVTDVVQVAATDGDSSLNDYNVIQYSIKGKKLLRRILQIHLFIHCKTLYIRNIKIWQFLRRHIGVVNLWRFSQFNTLWRHMRLILTRRFHASGNKECCLGPVFRLGPVFQPFMISDQYNFQKLLCKMDISIFS